MKDKVIGIYCIIDDMLKKIHHREDKRRRVSDSELITTALVSAMYFGGHHAHAIGFMKSTGMVPHMLDNSRYYRRIQKVSQLICDLFLSVGFYIKHICCETEYLLDSFPVAICDNIRIIRSKILSGKKWRGYTASMRRYFYGVKVQLLTTKNGIPVQFCFVPGKQADVKSMSMLLSDLPAESAVYADSAYTDYDTEDWLSDNKSIHLKSQRKSNSKRADSYKDFLNKLSMRKKVESAISDIKKLFPRTIHAVTFNGFLLKLILFIFAYQLNKIIN